MSMSIRFHGMLLKNISIDEERTIHRCLQEWEHHYTHLSFTCQMDTDIHIWHTPLLQIDPVLQADKKSIMLSKPNALIHLVLSSLTQGSPKIRVYTSERVQEEMQETASDYLNSVCVFDKDKMTVSCTKLVYVCLIKTRWGESNQICMCVFGKDRMTVRCTNLKCVCVWWRQYFWELNQTFVWMHVNILGEECLWHASFDYLNTMFAYGEESSELVRWMELISVYMRVFASGRGEWVSGCFIFPFLYLMLSTAGLDSAMFQAIRVGFWKIVEGENKVYRILARSAECCCYAAYYFCVHKVRSVACCHVVAFNSVVIAKSDCDSSSPCWISANASALQKITVQSKKLVFWLLDMVQSCQDMYPKLTSMSEIAQPSDVSLEELSIWLSFGGKKMFLPSGIMNQCPSKAWWCLSTVTHHNSEVWRRLGCCGSCTGHDLMNWNCQLAFCQPFTSRLLIACPWFVLSVVCARQSKCISNLQRLSRPDHRKLIEVSFTQGIFSCQLCGSDCGVLLAWN